MWMTQQRKQFVSSVGEESEIQTEKEAVTEAMALSLWMEVDTGAPHAKSSGRHAGGSTGASNGDAGGLPGGHAGMACRAERTNTAAAGCGYVQGAVVWTSAGSVGMEEKRQMSATQMAWHMGGAQQEVGAFVDACCVQQGQWATNGSRAREETKGSCCAGRILAWWWCSFRAKGGSCRRKARKKTGDGSGGGRNVLDLFHGLREGNGPVQRKQQMAAGGGEEEEEGVLARQRGSK
ncbi:hypothetical protein C8R45DRAFT_946201 [Mycena sanguinolenta]|nr:hypothetical protein C8R45DRAFT_946201 [Mycena sanguinolenta]